MRKEFSIFSPRFGEAGKFQFSKNKGLTLIELLVVIVVLGLLSAILLAAVDPVVQLEKGRDARRKSDLIQIQKVLEQYYDDNKGQYPQSTGSGSYQIKIGTMPLVWGASWIPYMNILPSDPKYPQRTYQYVSNGQSYYLYASLERGSADPNTCKSDGSKCDNAPTDASCGVNVICNYGLTSPNVSP